MIFKEILMLVDRVEVIMLGCRLVRLLCFWWLCWSYRRLFIISLSLASPLLNRTWYWNLCWSLMRLNVFWRSLWMLSLGKILCAVLNQGSNAWSLLNLVLWLWSLVWDCWRHPAFWLLLPLRCYRPRQVAWQYLELFLWLPVRKWFLVRHANIRVLVVLERGDLLFFECLHLCIILTLGNDLTHLVILESRLPLHYGVGFLLLHE
jgi:hypothetical protein